MRAIVEVWSDKKPGPRDGHGPLDSLEGHDCPVATTSPVHDGGIKLHVPLCVGEASVADIGLLRRVELQRVDATLCRVDGAATRCEDAPRIFDGQRGKIPSADSDAWPMAGLGRGNGCGGTGQGRGGEEEHKEEGGGSEHTCR